MGPDQNLNNNLGSDGEQSDYNSDSNSDSNADSSSDSNISDPDDSSSSIESEDTLESRQRHNVRMAALRRQNLALRVTVEAQELVLQRMRERTAEIQALNRIREEELLQLRTQRQERENAQNQD